jgi:outer membrane cobalamin receptor
LGAALKATYTEGFRPPSFFALGLPTVLGGNPDLRAETSRGGSVGYEQSVMKGRVSTTFSLFETRYADLVTYDNHTNRLINADQARIRGFEAEVNLKPVDALRLRGVFTRLLTRSGSSEEPLRQRPGQRAGIEIDWAIDDRSGLNWRTAFAKDTLDSSVLTGNVRLPALVRTDLTYTQQALKWLSLSAAIDNVFDRQNQSYIGAVGQRRRLRLSAGVTL